MSRKSRVVKGTLTSFIQYGLQILLQAALLPLILRVAGQETLGAYAILIQAIGYLSLVDLGFSAATSRYLAQAYGYDDEGLRFSQVISTFRTFSLCSNVVFAVLCLLLSIWIGPLLSLSIGIKFQAQLGLYFLAGWAVLRTPLAVYLPGLIATQNLVAANLVAILGNAGRLVLSLGLVVAGLGLVGLILANILAELLAGFFSRRLFLNNHPGILLSWRIKDRDLFRGMFHFGVQALLINIAVRLVFQTDNLVVGYLYGAVAASIYYATQMPATILYQGVIRLTDNATPAINELYARNMTESLRHSFLQLARYNLILILPVAIGLLFFCRPLIGLWVGHEQFGGNMMVIALALFAIIVTNAHVCNAFIMATGQIRILSILALVEGMMNLFLSIILAYYIGLAGVMWGTVIANLPTSAYLQRRAQRILGVSWREYIQTVFMPLIWPTAITVTIWITIQRQIQSDNWITLFLNVFAFIFIYGCLSYRFSINATERLWVKSGLQFF